MRIIHKLLAHKFYYLLNKNDIVTYGKLIVGRNTKIRNCKIFISEGSSLVIGDNCILDHVSICMMDSETNIQIGDSNTLIKCSIEPYRADLKIGTGNFVKTPIDSFPVRFRIQQAKLSIGDMNSLACGIWTRFGGICTIGSHNAINQRTEIRCDEKVTIGDYNQISYDCVIWDTNTHIIHKADERRHIVDKEYPNFGLETNKPKTSPVYIGDDCWIGRSCSILKGVEIGNRCIIAYNTSLVGGKYDSGLTITNSIQVRTFKNNL